MMAGGIFSSLLEGFLLKTPLIPAIGSATSLVSSADSGIALSHVSIVHLAGSSIEYIPT